jgi:hypothetical protein
MAQREVDAPDMTRRRFLRLAAAGSGLAMLAGLEGRYGLVGSALAQSRVAPVAPASTTTLGLTTHLGVPADPSIDVCDKITEVLAKVYADNPTATPTVLLEGLYRIDRPVMLHGLRNLRIAATSTSNGFIRYSQATKPYDWTPKVPFYPYVSVRDSEDLVFEGFRVQGPLTSPIYDSVRESAAGVHIQGASRNVTVRNVSIAGVHGDFVKVAEHQQHLPTGILVESVTGNVAGRQMIADVGGNGLTVRRCHFKNAARSGLDVEPSSPLGSHNVTLEDSLFENMGLYGIAGGNRRPHTNIVVRRCRFYGGRGLIKYGPPEGTLGTHRGLVLEDVTYEPRPDWYAGLTIVRTMDVSLRRVYARLRSSNSIEGTGEVRDSVFTSADSGGDSGGKSGGGSGGKGGKTKTATTTTTALVFLCGVTDVNNVGTGGCPTAR